MTGKTGCAGNSTIFAYSGATRNTDTGRNGGVLANNDIVGNLYQVIQTYPVVYFSIAKGTAIDAGVGTNLHR